MRRLLKQGIAWTLSTAAAGMLSWWGVHTVMAATAYPPPSPIALTDTRVEEEKRREDSGPASTHRPDAGRATARPTPSGGSGEAVEKPSPSPTPSAGADPAPTRGGATPSREPGGTAGGPGDRPAAGAGEVKGYAVDGGRVTFDMKRDYAELVSAVPDAGWRMQVWKHPLWIRVTFTEGDREISVFCSWHEHPPLVEIEGQ
ncbi:hypothetical protein ACFV2V_21975 [Streptomyces sp. NPDC059698]|uniref:hypothetical protein n=1 Tax=unclassified Streptomyces TaxID=2593676 RepID=UPI00093B4295|nr:hypothetical protein [Streptomyces sp. CB02366]OKJ33458.1 hypothetical protein AMK24_24620 [Streptomyces sp. CB02366]